MYYDTDWSWDIPADKQALPEPWPADSPLWPDNSDPARYVPRQKGTFFDEAIDLRDPKGDTMTRQVLELIYKAEIRERAPSQKTMDNRYKRVRAILANGFRCHLHRDPSWVAYSRKADGYRNKPQWLSGDMMRQTVELMVTAGLVENNLGGNSRDSKGTCSTYRITERLWSIAADCGISESGICRNPSPDSLVRLYERKKVKGKNGPYRTTRKHKREPVEFDPTPDTVRWSGLLQSYNAFIAQQDIAVELTEDEQFFCVDNFNSELEKRIRQGGTIAMLLKRPELFRTDLCRVFSNNSFEEGGRLYGGWWINFPRSLRSKITINGQPTIELDYAGCAIRMLYHERGIDYDEDPYFLEPIAALARMKGLEVDHYRSALKDMLQAAINEDDPDKEPWLIPLDGVSFLPEYKRREVYDMLAEKHAPIVDTFRTGAGLRLQRSESDLVLSIISILAEEEISALPVHDAIIVPKENGLLLKELMLNEYYKSYGLYPIVK